MELKKELQFWDIFCIALGTMISSGVFVLPSLGFTKSGPVIVLAYLLGGIIASFGIMSLVELGTAMPKAGGDYFYVTRSMGPVFGTVSGTISWIASLLETAFAILGIGSVVSYLIYGGFNKETVIFVGIIATLFFGMLNIIGVDLAGKFERIVVITVLFFLIVFIISGIKIFDISRFTPFIQIYENKELVKVDKLFTSDGLKVLLYTISFIFVTFGGFTSAISTAEEVKNPKRNIPLGLFSALIVGTIVVSLVVFVTIGILDGKDLVKSLYPLSDAENKVYGHMGYIGVLYVALFAFVSTANAGILSASRYPLALSRDGLYPKKIGKIHEKFKTPVYSIYLSIGIVMVLIFLPLDILAEMASAVVFSTLIFTNIAIIILRESKVHNYRPTYKIPFYPVFPVVGIFLYYVGLSILGFKAILMIAVIVLVAVLIYFKYGKYNYSKEYAFQHLILEISKTVNVEHDLETELREIITSRDEIELDNFDRLVTKSIIMDLHGPLSLDELIMVEAHRLAEIVSFQEEDLMKLFKAREEQSSTAFTKFTAIPHIVVDKDDFFTLAIIRCKEGIKFNEEFNSVKAVFLFISGKNLRKEHLHTLASIANLVRDEKFEEDWLSAKNENYIRDLILLSERKRIFKK